MAVSGTVQNFLGGVATNATGNIVTAIFQKLEDINELDKNGEILGTNFGLVQQMLNNIRNQFEDQQKRMEKPLETILTKMEKALQEAEDLINRANRYRASAWYERLWNLNLPTQVSAWKDTYDALIQELHRVCSIHAMTLQIVSAAAPQAEPLLQPVPDSGFRGSGIRTAAEMAHRPSLPISRDWRVRHGGSWQDLVAKSHLQHLQSAGQWYL